jgi:DNA-binding transcriptional LysR family regulator
VNEDALNAFVAVAEHRHFRRAAASQHVAASTLSRRVTALERDTRLVLVDRSAGAVALTEQGEQFLPVARRLLAELAATKTAARTIRAAAHDRRIASSAGRRRPLPG